MKTSMRAKIFNRSRWLGLFLAATLLLGLLAGCNPAPKTQEGAEAAHINYGISDAWDSLMPYNSISGSNYSRIIYDKIYDRLAYVRADGSCLPRGADSWESADDGYAILFHLNQKAKFHDGTAVTAQHWADSIRLVTNPAVPALGRTAFSDLAGTDENGVGDESLGVELPDQYTLKLRFKAPVTPEEFLVERNREYYVLPVHLMADASFEEVMDLDLWRAPIGSGPCRFVSEISGSTLNLEANKGYHLGSPGFDTMTIRVMDKSNQLTALMAGDLDYYTFGNSVSEENASIAEAVGFTVVEGQVPTTFYELMLNNESISQPMLRQAIHMALDRDLLARQNSGDLGIPTLSSILPGTAYAITPQSEELARDLAAAQALVAEQYDGRTYLLACTSARSGLAALIQQNLQEAGFKVEILTVDSATLFSGMYDGDYDMAVASHTPSSLPLWFVGTRFKEDNNLFRVGELGGYEERIDAIRTTDQVEMKRDLVMELERYFKQEMPFVPLWFSTSLYIESKTVEGIDYPAASFSNENVWDWVKS